MTTDPGPASARVEALLLPALPVELELATLPHAVGEGPSLRFAIGASTRSEPAATMSAVTAAGAGPAPGPDRLFTYGTLMTGFSRRPLLGGALLEGLGRIRGSLYHFGEYPGLVLDDGGWVTGELYQVPDLPDRLPALDREEWYDPADEARSLYVRRTVPVQAAGGVVREAWVYTYNERFGPAAGRGPRVESGDWRAHLTSARGTHTVSTLEDPR